MFQIVERQNLWWTQQRKLIALEIQIILEKHLKQAHSEILIRNAPNDCIQGFYEILNTHFQTFSRLILRFFHT